LIIFVHDEVFPAKAAHEPPAPIRYGGGHVDQFDAAAEAKRFVGPRSVLRGRLLRAERRYQDGHEAGEHRQRRSDAVRHGCHMTCVIGPDRAMSSKSTASRAT
jgi:hypothetical protein